MSEARGAKEVLIRIDDTAPLSTVGDSIVARKAAAEALAEARAGGVEAEIATAETAFETAESAEDEAIGLAQNAFALVHQGKDNIQNRVARVFGGRKGLNRLFDDIRGSRGVRGEAGENALSFGSLAGAAATANPALLTILAQRGLRAITGVRGMRQRRKDALDTFNDILNDLYVMDGKTLVPRPNADLDLGEGLQANDVLQNLNDVYDLYSEYIDVMNKPVAERVRGENSVHNRSQGVVSQFDFVDFVREFSKVGFDPVNGARTRAPVNLGSHRINVNTASVDELQRLPRIGRVTAERIVEYRQANGPFGSLQDLAAVRNVGDATVAGLLPTATVGD
jgi:competence ComEA-like helix-hairpin-helix protein